MVTALTAVAGLLAYWATAPPAMVAAVAGLVVAAYWATAPPATAIQSRAGPYLAGTFTPAARVRAAWAILGAFAGPSRAPP